MPAPPYSSSTVMPCSPSAPSSGHSSIGKRSVRSISAASGAIRSSAKSRTVVRSMSISDPRSKSSEASRVLCIIPSSCPRSTRASTKGRGEPRLPGQAQGCPVPVLVPLERQLSRIGRGRRLDLQQAIDGPPVHQIGAHQPDEGERAVNDFLSSLRQAQQQEGDQGDGDLDLDGILAGAKKAGDLEDLLDPAKEQLDCPASLVEPGDLRCGGV